MKLEKCALIAEIIGGFAIVVSLVVLIFEVRGTTDAIQAQTAQATFGISTGSFYYPEGNIALDKMQREESLTVEEAAHAEALLSAIFTSFDNHYYQYRHGNLDQEIHDAYRTRLLWLMRSKPVRDAWIVRSPLHTEGFRLYVDEVVREVAAEGH